MVKVYAWYQVGILLLSCAVLGLILGGGLGVFQAYHSPKNTTNQDIPFCIFPIKTQVICVGDTTSRCLACMESQGQMSCYKFHPHQCKTW